MIGEIAVAGNSWLHRLGPIPKIVALLTAGTALFFVSSPGLMAMLLATLAVAWISSGVGWRPLWQHGRWLLLLALAASVITAWGQGLQAGWLSGLRLATLMGMALLVSLTTPVNHMVEALERLLAPLGRRGWVHPEKVAFGLALVLRFAPELARNWRQLQEAQRARGLRMNPVRLAVPLLIQLLRNADLIAEAIDARGWPPEPSSKPDPSPQAKGKQSPPPRIR